MTLRARSPAPVEQLLELWAKAHVLKPLQVRWAILQAARSESIGWYDGDELVAAALLYPQEETADRDVRELVFACLPRAAAHMLQLVRAAHLTALALPDDVVIRARVRAGHAPGRRLALLCGLKPAGVDDGYELYEGP